MPRLSVIVFYYVATQSHYFRSVAPLKIYLAERSVQELITLIGSGKIVATLVAII